MKHFMSLGFGKLHNPKELVNVVGQLWYKGLTLHSSCINKGDLATTRSSGALSLSLFDMNRSYLVQTIYEPETCHQ